MISDAEYFAQSPIVTSVQMGDGGIIVGDPFTYIDGTTSEALRSGVDGPHHRLADRLCGLNGRLYE